MPNDKKKVLGPGDIKYKQMVADLSKQAIESGAAYDYNKIQAENPVSDSVYTGVEAAYGIKPIDYFDPYKDYVAEGTLRGGQFSTEDLNNLRSNHQSNWEQAGNAVGRLAVNIVPQITAGFASMLDLQGYWDAEHAANNGFVKMADSVKKWSDEVMPIYEENPDKFMQMGDFAWWMTRGEGLVESIGSFVVQGFGAGKAVSLGAKGAAKLLAATMKAKTAKTIVGATSKLTTAAMLNQSEAVIEASQVYQTTLDNSLAKGLSYEDAKLKASQAAATTMNINRVNILLNLTSAGAFLSPQKFTRQLLTAPSLKKVGGEILKEGTQEAAEEVVNYYAQKAGEARGRGVTNYLEQGFKDMDAMEGFEAAFLGAIGGIAQTGGTSALRASKYGPGNIKNEDGTRTSGLAAAREQYTKQQEAIQEMKANGVKITDALMNIEEQQKFEQKLFEASERGDQDEVSNLQSQMFENQVLKAFNTGSTEVLEELYKAEAQRDPAEVGPEYIARANEALKRMAALEDIYNNYEDYANVNEIFFNRATADRVAIQEKNLDALVKNSQVDFGLQVREIADKYKFQHKHEGIIKEDGKEVDRTEFTRESNLTYSLSDLENNHGDTEENRKIYNKFLNEVKKTQAYKVHEGYKAQYDQVSKLRNGLQEQFSEITSRSYQEKVVAEKAEAAKVSAIKNDIFTAKTIPEVEQLAAQTENASVQKLAKERIEILNNQNAAIAKQKKVDLITGELNNKIVQAELDQQEALEKEIEEAEISQERKVELRNKLANRIKLLNGELVEGTTEIADPLSVFTQGKDLEAQINQEEKDFETTIPVDLPIPSEEADTVENEVINATESLIQQDKTFLIGIDPQGNLIFNYDRSSEGYNRAAYLSREFSQSDSEGIIDREDSTNTIENPQVLGPNNLLAGTKLILSVDTEYEGQKYDPSSTTRATMSWPARLAQLQQIAAQNGVPVTELNEYIAEVPIKVTLENGEKVFYVHDNSWYKEENLNATPEEIAEDQRKNFEIRKAVIKKGIAKSKVDYKSFGRLFKTADGKPVTLSEAMPDSKLIIATGKDGGFKLPNEAVLKGDTIINTSKTQEGRPYAIVQVGPKEYLGIPLQRQKLAKEVVDSIMFAVEAHLTNDPNNPVVKAIVEETGLDILETEGLRQYVNQFTYIFPTEKAEGLENILVQGGQKSKLKSNTPIISIIPAGQATEIQFGRPGVAMGSYTDAATNQPVTKYSVSISRNFEGAKGARSNAAGMDKLRGVLEASLSNVVVENLALNKNAAIIMSADGEMLPITYLQHVKDSHVTNVLSTNIGTEEKPEWVYTIQPTVLFDTKFAGIDSTKKQRKAQPTTKVVTPPITVTPTPAPSIPVVGTTIDIEAERAAIEKRRQEKLKIAKRNFEFLNKEFIPKLEENTNALIEQYDFQKSELLKNTGDLNYVESKYGKTFEDWIPLQIKWLKENKSHLLVDSRNSESIAYKTLRLLQEKNDTENKINAKYDAELAALESAPKMGTAVEVDQVAAYRAEEQAELLEVIPNIESYKVNGEIDKTLMPKTVLAKYNKIYDKYDKLITPLLAAQKIRTTELNQILTKIKNYWKSFLEQSKVNQDQLMIDVYNEALDRLEANPIEFVEDMINKFPSDSEEFRDYQAALNLLKPSASAQVEELTSQEVLSKLGITNPSAQSNSIIDQGTILADNPRLGLAASFGLVPVTVDQNELETAPLKNEKLLSIFGVPTAQQQANTSQVAKTVSEELMLEEIAKTLKSTGSVKATILKFTKPLQGGSFEFLSAKQMQFLINSAVELGIEIPPISQLYASVLDEVHEQEIYLNNAQEVKRQVEQDLRDKYETFEKLGTTEEQLLAMGYPPLKDSYTTEELKAFAQMSLDLMAKNHAKDFAKYESGKKDQSSRYDDYRLYKQILAPGFNTAEKSLNDLKAKQKQDRAQSIIVFEELENSLKEAPTNLLNSPAEDVEELTGQALIESHAEEILTQGIPLKDLEGFVNNIENDVIATEDLLKQGFGSRQMAIDSFKLAIAKAKQNSSTTTLPNGITIKIDGTTIDDADPEDDTTIDDSIPALEAENIADIKEEAGSLLLNGLGTTEQYSLISYLAADVMQQALNAKEVDGIRKIETAPIFEKHLESLKQMQKLYKEAGLPNKAKKVQMVIDQFDKAKALTNQYMSLLTTGSVKEDLNLNDSEQASGLDKLVYSDEWAFTINSKSTASADLRKFFSFVEAKNENGDLITSPLGFPEIIPFDVVYDTLHEILANKPADYTTMIDTLEVYKEKLPWLQSVIDNIEKAPERIQNEFVSDMSKHHISMQFVMWKKNPNGQYSLTRWSSNASAVKERLRRSWNSNMHNPFGGSNLIAVDPAGNYIFDAEVADYLYETAKEWEADSSTVTNDELANWLGNFGIVLTDETYKDLRDGKYKNQGSKSWDGLFTNSAGLVKVLAKKIKDVTNQKINVEQANILNDSAVEALAALDATNNLNIFSNSFRTGGKTVYSYGNNNYLINRMRDLTAYDEQNKKFINAELIDDLNNISFTRDSLWLRELQADSEAGQLMRSNLRLDYVSLEALKQEYRAPKDDSKLKNLNIDEHEIVKLGMFFNASKKIVDGEVRRVASLFYNTMSDKSTMLTMSFLTRQVELEQEGLSEANLELLYEALVQPEVNRMRGEQSKNINGYEPNYFYFLPGLNDQLMIQVNGTEQSFRDIVMAKNNLYFQPEVKEAVLKYLKDTFNTLLQEKLADWETLGIGLTLKNEQGKITDKNTFLDAEYMNKIAQGNAEGKVRYAAADYLFNTLIAGSETYKLFAGDPALYAKFKKGKTLQQNLEETFTNMGKRLAGDIAPGLELANSKGSSYYQVFLADKKLNSNNVLDAEQKAYFNKIVSTYSEDYSGIEGSDAQEYTTWKEHLYVMKQLGRLTQEQFNTLSRKLTNQSNGNFSKENKLNYAESLLVLQPMKPVYVGNVASREDNADRRVYVKSSSFPLIPQLTVGRQLDKLRRALENFEDSKKNETSVSGSPKFVRASFGTANKTGAVNAPIEVFDDKGNVLDNISIADANTLELPRENFRIQQDVPYDRDKTSVNIGTQERKLLFVDALDLEISKGRTGQDLMNEYNKAYQELFVDAQDNLSRKLGLIEEVAPDDVFTTFASMTPDPTLIDTIAARSEEIAKISSPIKKQTAQQEFADEIGEDNLERVNFINKNFDKIVEALAASKINVFFDENDQFKKCD